MEFCWGLPIYPTSQHQELFNAYLDHSKRAEANYFDSVLLSVAPTAVDPFVAATMIGMNTKQIRVLIAQNTNQVIPTHTAKALNTLNALIGDRADINIVTGSASMTLARDGKPESHDVRYARTREYTDLLQRLRKGVTTFKGEFFYVENSDIYPKENPEHRASYFVAGSSESAMDAAARYGDAYILYACDRQTLAAQYEKVKTMAKAHGREGLKYAVLVDIIARETTEEAWKAAYELLERTPAALKRMTKLFLKNADSVGLSRYKDLSGGDDFMVDKHLWGGLSQVNPSNSISIVGNYEEVISTLRDFRDAGADYFLITALASDEHEIERIGQQIVRPLKEEEI
ncbi:LLM class flavin-dependent oxidoreductase [Tumebacillus sp. ITR2]|uniref:LLM class flavin-dependent oxidoreductase n=1 Tax=Tumebacillus amylolyticus TaxID=2801339 RepID=A0ABS1JED9_9BACL|nr:LLM class flavin-dependent oxidoreductase [Tumebacillus amylolyticus]MBL0388659.1 LLM class flavin-dependent oxidoreductase [Tumebacillus amylolyticus]